VVEPGLGILMTSLLELEAWVLTRVRSNFGEPLEFHVVQLLVHQIPKHSHAFNGGEASFNQENMVGIISFNLEVLCYKFHLNHLNIFP